MVRTKPKFSTTDDKKFDKGKECYSPSIYPIGSTKIGIIKSSFKPKRSASLVKPLTHVMAGQMILPLPKRISKLNNTSTYPYNTEFIKNIPIYSLFFSQALNLSLITDTEIQKMLIHALGSPEQKMEADRLLRDIVSHIDNKISSEASLLDPLFKYYDFHSDGFYWDFNFTVASVDHFSPDLQNGLGERVKPHTLVHQQCGLHALRINIMDTPDNLRPYYIRLIKYLCFIGGHPTIFDLYEDEYMSFYLMDEELHFDDKTIESILKMYKENNDPYECFASYLDQLNVLDNYDDSELMNHITTLQFMHDMKLLNSLNPILTCDEFELFETQLRHEPNTPQWMLDLVSILPKCFSNNSSELDAVNLGHINTNYLLPVIFGTENEDILLNALNEISMTDDEMMGIALNLTESNVDALTIINKAELLLYFISEQLIDIK